MKGRVIQDLKDWRRSLQRFKREAERDGDYLIDWRPWAKGERTHVAAVDARIKNVEWLLGECKRREAKKDAAFFEALEIAKIGVALDWSDRMEVSAPALEAYQRQRSANREINARKALTEEERARARTHYAAFWRQRPKARKADALRSVARSMRIPERRVRSYVDELPVPYLGDGS